MTDSKQWEKELEKIKKEVYYEIPTMGRGGEYVSMFKMWNMLEIKLLPFITSAINQARAEERERVVGMIGEDEMAISQSSMNSGRMSKQEAFIVEIRNKFRTELKAKIKDSQPTY